MTKICTKCGKERDLACFQTIHKKNGDYVRPDCKICCAERATEWAKNNPDKVKKHKEKFNTTHRDELIKYHQIYRQTNKEKNKKYQKEYFQKNKEKIIARNSQKRKTDIQYHLSCILRERLNKVIVGNYKNGSSIEDLGCSLKELQTHIESKFDKGMSWNNYGEWHIDHIIPLCKFDLKDRNQFLKACHYTNLQPLWAKDNLMKGGRLT